MIELHFHCLPGIDDGPTTWDDAVELCRAAAREGTTTIVATPHVLRRQWSNEDPEARARLVGELNDRLGGRPTVLPGSEYLFGPSLLELLEDPASPLTRLNGGRYLLVEFGSLPAPGAVENVFHEMSLLGTTPIVAHPERHAVLSRDPGRVAALVDRGAAVQVTAGSLLGEFGEAAQLAAEELMRRGLVHLVASDAHDARRRPPRLAAARSRVRRDWGIAAEEAIFERHPAAVLASLTLDGKPVEPTQPAEPAGPLAPVETLPATESA